MTAISSSSDICPTSRCSFLLSPPILGCSKGAACRRARCGPSIPVITRRRGAKERFCGNESFRIGPNSDGTYQRSNQGQPKPENSSSPIETFGDDGSVEPRPLCLILLSPSPPLK